MAKNSGWGAGARNKYRAKKTVVDGIMFASKREARRWGELRLMEMAGAIQDLRRQVRYRLDVDGLHVCDYIADFRYISEPGQAEVVEDCKGFRTREYVLKRKLMKAIHGIDILET